MIHVILMDLMNWRPTRFDKVEVKAVPRRLAWVRVRVGLRLVDPPEGERSRLVRMVGALPAWPTDEMLGLDDDACTVAIVGERGLGLGL
jgi:hypothetical protein